MSEMSDVKDVIAGPNIAGVAPGLALPANRMFNEYKLDPYMGDVGFEDNEIEITVSAYFRGEEYDDEQVQKIVDEIVAAAHRQGLRGIEGEGYHSEISGDALMVFRQSIDQDSDEGDD